MTLKAEAQTVPVGLWRAARLWCGGSASFETGEADDRIHPRVLVTESFHAEYNPLAEQSGQVDGVFGLDDGVPRGGVLQVQEAAARLEETDGIPSPPTDPGRVPPVRFGGQGLDDGAGDRLGGWARDGQLDPEGR